MAITNQPKTCSNLQFYAPAFTSCRLLAENARDSRLRHFISLALDVYVQPTVDQPAMLHPDKCAILSSGEDGAIYDVFLSDPTSQYQPLISRAQLIYA